MTVKELRYLVDNLDEYIHVPGGIERLKKTVLHLAVSGQLVPQDPAEGTGEELFQQIQAEKAKLIAAGKLKKQKPLPAITKAEIPFAIPKTWKWARLGEVVNLKSGADLRPNQYNAHNDGVPYITGASNLDNGQVIINRWTPEPKNIAERGNLLLTCKGTIGAMAFLHVDKAHIARQLMAIRFTQLQNPGFIKIIIETKLQTLQAAAQSIIPGIAREDVLGMTVALPPLFEQKRIVKKVEAIFALIDELAEKYRAEQVEREKLVMSSLAQLARGNGGLALTHLSEIIRTKADASQLRKTILHLAVSGQLVPQDPSEGTGEELFRQIQAEKAKLIAEGKLKKQKPLPAITEAEIPFAIPKTWKWVRLGNVGLSQTGSTPSKNNPEYFGTYVPFIKPGDISENSIDYENEGLSEQGAKIIDRIAKSGSLLMVCIGTIGKCQLISKACSFNQQINSITPYIDISKFLLISAQSKYFTDLAWEKSSSTTIAILNKGKWESILIPLPPLAEQTRIVQITTQFLNLISKLEPRLEK